MKQQTIRILSALCAIAALTLPGTYQMTAAAHSVSPEAAQEDTPAGYHASAGTNAVAEPMVTAPGLHVGPSLNGSETAYALPWGAEIIDMGEETLYFLDGIYLDYISIPEELPRSYQIHLDVADEEISYSTNSKYIQVDENGLVRPKSSPIYTVSPSGTVEVDEYRAGDYTVTARVGDIYYTYLFHVMDYSHQYAYETVDRYLEEHITDNLSVPEKLQKVCEFVCQYDYSVDHSDMINMIVTGEGGDCWASTDTVNYMCEKLGYRAKLRGRNVSLFGGGHLNSAVEADGAWYIIEAGYTGKAPRQYTISEYDTPYLCDKLSDGTAEFSEYLGFDTELVIPETIDGRTVTSIGESAIYYVERYLGEPLTSVILPETITSIGDAAFYNCDGLTELYLPAGVSHIEKAAFNSCDNLQLMISEDNPYFTIKDSVLFTADEKTLLQAVGFKDSAYQVPDGVEIIEDQAFYGVRTLSAVSFPDTLVDIGYRAFDECGLKNTQIVLPESVTGIGCDAISARQSTIVILNPDCVINNTMENNLYEYEDGDTLMYSRIFGYAGSTAQAYAERFDKNFTAIESIPQGDADLDGSISVADVIRLQKYLMTTSEMQQNSESRTQFSQFEFGIADMNQDKAVDVFDLALLKRKLIFGSLTIS